MNIIIIEDDEYLTNILQNTLDFEGHRILACYRRASDVIDNLEHLNNVDVIILDLIMRRKKNIRTEFEVGEYLYERIKQIYPSIIFIVATALDFKALSNPSLISDIHKGITYFTHKTLDPNFGNILHILDIIQEDN